MTLPTPQEARSRQTAMEAERHWWKSRLKALWEECETRSYAAESQPRADAFKLVADKLLAIVAERERP